MTMTPTPVRIVNQCPTSTLRSTMTKKMPLAAMTPARTPPDTDVIPARYAVVNRSRPPSALNDWKVTVCC